MRGNGRSSFRASESGSTLLEAIVALAIISILGIGAWNAVGASIRLAARMREKAMENVHVLQLDDALRELSSRVRAPYWAAGHGAAAEAGSISIPNLDGEPEKSFTISFQEGILLLDDGERVMRFTDFTRAEFSAAADDTVGTFGLTMDVTTKSGGTFSMTVRFAGLPIGNGKSE